MSPPESYEGFGHALRAQRQRQGLELADLARRTKIPPTLLDALEEGQAERFPERPFVTNYVRSYAAAVGLPPDETLARFQRIPGEAPPDEFDPAVLEVARRERAWTALWVTVASVLVVAAGLAVRALQVLTYKYGMR